MPGYRRGNEGVGGAPLAPQKTKIPHVALQRAKEGMSEAQKEGIKVWNLMVKTLRDNELMEDK